jgi:peptidoglycan/LPS O-acetylase OafA/YrhL
MDAVTTGNEEDTKLYITFRIRKFHFILIAVSCYAILQFQWYVYGAHLICVLPLSMFLHLAVEAPLMILLRTLFKKSMDQY